ncbi:SMP-30/gluconolactonase/LRE family protein [Paenibacillus sp. J2TS4]|uniref:SMP-30/gluconolactonase/LRE family protein n=1 Tax=Paenibacillus sp. J2TS4 TaxID=2807194 RepID=UPI001B2C5050|nr:SMP-30/gluconolactonase/LRE family protein [Paenibacillus sp. J2TS4]GIP34993.1 gluconolactonase [Paenibacillus sp. J2TS4]
MSQNYISREFTARHTFTSGIEGPASDREGNIYAVNYEKQHTIGKVTPDGRGEIFLELPGGSVGNGIRFDRDGRMYIADYVHHNIFKVDMTTREWTIHAHEPKMNQPNDIAITRDGVVFASDPNWSEKNGQLWRIDPSGAVTLLETGMGTTNGIEVSPDERVLYVNETVQRTVWAYDLNEAKEMSNKRLLIRFPDFGLDGMRCDMEGNLYVTRHGKGTVAKLSPAGELLQEVRLEGTDCTNLTFGGPDGKQCYVTVADTGNIQTFTVDAPGRCWGMWA